MERAKELLTRAKVRLHHPSRWSRIELHRIESNRKNTAILTSTIVCKFVPPLCWRWWPLERQQQEKQQRLTTLPPLLVPDRNRWNLRHYIAGETIHCFCIWHSTNQMLTLLQSSVHNRQVLYLFPRCLSLSSFRMSIHNRETICPLNDENYSMSFFLYNNIF